MDRIKSHQEIETIFNTGTWQHHSLVKVLILESEQRDQTPGRVAFIAGKKTGNAVCRNKAKRMMRAAAHDCVLVPQPGVDLVFVATNRTKTASLHELTAALNKLLTRAGYTNTESNR